MTHLEKFRALYDEIGVRYTMNPYGDDEKKGVISMRIGDDGVFIIDNKIDGYTGFYTLIVFSQEGEFIEQGFWE